jgi:hypothetical protein
VNYSPANQHAYNKSYREPHHHILFFKKIRKGQNKTQTIYFISTPFIISYFLPLALAFGFAFTAGLETTFFLVDFLVAIVAFLFNVNAVSPAATL